MSSQSISFSSKNVQSEEKFKEYMQRLKSAVSNIPNYNSFEKLAETDTLEIFKSIISFINDQDDIYSENEPVLYLMPAILELFTKLFSEIDIILRTPNLNNNFKQITRIIECCIELLELIHNIINHIISLKKVKLYQFQSIPKNVAHILYISYKHCSESELKYGEHLHQMGSLLNSLFKKNNDVQLSFFTLLNDVFIFDIFCDDAVEILVEVVELIGQIGELVAGLDIKTMAEHWKGYAKLTQQYNEELKPFLNISSPVKFLITNILKNLIDIIDLPVDDQKNLTRLLKIGNFMLKITIKLSEIYELKDVHSELCNLLFILHRYSAPYLHLKKIPLTVISSIESHFSVGAEPLLSILIQDIKFFEVYNKMVQSKCTNEENYLGILLLSIAMLKKISDSTLEIRSIWFDNENNIIVSIFKIVKYCHKELSSDIKIHVPNLPGVVKQFMSLYEVLLIHLAVACITLSSDNFRIIETELMRSVMQQNFWRALLAIDLWCILGRYGSSELCFDHLLYIVNAFKQICHDLNRPERSYIKILISRLYPLLTEKDKLRFTEICTPIENPIVWSTIGLENLCNNRKTNEIMNLVKILVKDIKIFLSGNLDVKKFIHLCDILQLMPFNALTDDDSDLINLIISLWKCVIVTPTTEKYFSTNEINDRGRNWLSYFIISLCHATKSIVMLISNSQLCQVLIQLKDLQNYSSSNIKIQILLFLKSLSLKEIDNTSDQNEIFQLIAFLFYQLLNDRNPIIRQIAFEVFKYFAHVTEHEKIVVLSINNDEKLQLEIVNYLQGCADINSCTISYEEYLSQQNNVEFKHKCEDRIEESVYEIFAPQAKKIKLDNVCDLVEKLKIEVSTISEYAEHNDLSAKDKIEIKNIVFLLNKLL